MNKNSRYTKRSARYGSALLLAILTILSAERTANAGSLTFVAPNTFGAAGSPNNVFDVTLVNYDSIPYNIAGEAFVLSVDPASGIQFTDATTATTVPYLFQASADDDLGVPLSDLVPPTPATTITVADSEDLPYLYRTVNPTSNSINIQGVDTFGVAHISFTVDPSLAPGTVIPLTLTTYANFPEALNDDQGNFFPFLTIDGSITILESPEPSTFAMAAIAACGGLAVASRKKKRGDQPPPIIGRK